MNLIRLSESKSYSDNFTREPHKLARIRGPFGTLTRKTGEVLASQPASNKKRVSLSETPQNPNPIKLYDEPHHANYPAYMLLYARVLYSTAT